MESSRIISAIREQQLPAKGLAGVDDALTDPLTDLASEIIDQMADLAKQRLRKLDGLPVEEPEALPLLPKNSVLRKAKTAEELGLTDEMARPWNPVTDEKPLGRR